MSVLITEFIGRIRYYWNDLSVFETFRFSFIFPLITIALPYFIFGHWIAEICFGISFVLFLPMFIWGAYRFTYLGMDKPYRDKEWGEGYFGLTVGYYFCFKEKVGALILGFMLSVSLIDNFIVDL